MNTIFCVIMFAYSIFIAHSSATQGHEFWTVVDGCLAIFWFNKIISPQEASEEVE